MSAPIKPERKFTLDTNVLIRAFREPAANVALMRFHQAFAPFEYLSAVVVQELRAGAASATSRRAIERNVITPFERRGRIVTPSARAWFESGDVLGEIARRDRLDLARMSKAFGNDVLIALSCREAGTVLITENVRDFARIARVVPFDYSPPWPAATGA